MNINGVLEMLLIRCNWKLFPGGYLILSRVLSSGIFYRDTFSYLANFTGDEFSNRAESSTNFLWFFNMTGHFKWKNLGRVEGWVKVGYDQLTTPSIPRYPLFKKSGHLDSDHLEQVIKIVVSYYLTSFKRIHASK